MLALHDVHKQFNGSPVLHGVSLGIEQGDIVCLLGASGCGKTTLLRIIAGLESAESGSILLKGQDISQTPVHQRGFGLMFQDYALFPHLSAAQNVAFGLQMQKRSRPAVQERVQEVLHLVGMAAFAGRAVHELSGGEQQRIALARSLAPQPHLLMLDEPLGSLDAALRERLAVELRQIIKNAGVTAIYVTHDQQEAFAIADRIAVMNAGQIEQVSPPETLYQQPQSAYVAEFLGLRNILPVEECHPFEGGYLAKTALGVFTLSRPAQQVLLHPSTLQIVAGDGLVCTVKGRIFRGMNYQMFLEHASGRELTLYTSNPPPIGERVRVKTGAGIPL